MSRVLVAGGAGFIGSHLCDRLLADGHHVVAVDSFLTGSARNLAHLGREPRFTLVEADLTVGVPVEGRIDRIFNLACPASPIDYLEKPFETLYAGSHATRHLLERAERDHARLLQASTSEVYGDPHVHPQPESYWGHVNPIGVRSVYDESKRFAEALVVAFRRYGRAETRLARIFNTFGPRMRTHDGRVIPAYCTQALAGKPLTVFGDGSQTRSLCYVTDLVDGLVRLMESDLDEPCNLGNPHELTMLELAHIVRETVGIDVPIEFKPLPSDDPRQRKPDIKRAKERLGWEPKVPFEEGLRQTLNYFRDVI